MTIRERQAAIVAEMAAIGGWQERYKHIIALGRDLPAYPDAQRTDDKKIKGCQSQVWLHATRAGDGTITFEGDSDASIVKGLVALVLRAYSGAPAAEIAATPATFLDELGLSENLSQTRANGLAALVKQVKLYGVAFAAMERAR